MREGELHADAEDLSTHPQFFPSERPPPAAVLSFVGGTASATGLSAGGIQEAPKTASAAGSVLASSFFPSPLRARIGLPAWPRLTTR
jgi:hypothetical protein